MQDDQHADSHIAHEPVSESCDTPPKKHGRLVAFFAKMYSPHGTLTCKEFIWPAVYLLTLGKILSALLVGPIYLVNFISPLRNLDMLYKIAIATYMFGVHIAVFLYPIFNICIKVLQSIELKKIYIKVIIITFIIIIEVHPLFLDENELLHYILPHLLCILLTIMCYFLGKYFKYSRYICI